MKGQTASPFSSHAYGLTLWLTQLPPGLLPSEIGSPFSGILFPGAFTDAAHKDHIHIGFD